MGTGQFMALNTCTLWPNPPSPLAIFDNWLDALKKYELTLIHTYVIFVVTSICICCTGVFISTWSRSSCCDREPDVGKETLHGAEGNAYWYETTSHMTLTWLWNDFFLVKVRLIYKIFDWQVLTLGFWPQEGPLWIGPSYRWEKILQKNSENAYWSTL